MSRGRLTILSASLALLFLATSANAQVKLRFSAFGDFVYGVAGGDYANADSRTTFDLLGHGDDPVNTNRGFGVTGTDFVIIADITPELTFLGEINLQAVRGRSGEIELDVERFFVNYLLDPKFNVQAGLFFTPIGYNNRFLYARAWLMNSIQVPDFYEEELNLIPTHTIGVSAFGEFFIGDEHRIGYVGSVGNGRATAPDGAVYARDPSRSKEVTGLIEWLLPGHRESRIGVSGWYGGIESTKVELMGDIVNGGGADLKMQESGVDAFVVLNTKHVSLNIEYVQSWQRDRLANLSTPTYVMRGGMAEVALHFLKGQLHPFVRYDRTSLPDGGGPYLSLREDGGVFTRVYVPEFQALLTGAAYDVNAHLRLKVEFGRHLDGPRRTNQLAFQTAFGF